jgi:hypothetical protein
VAGGKGRINLTVCVIARLIQGAKPHSKPRFESWYPNRVSELSMVGPLVLGARHTLRRNGTVDRGASGVSDRSKSTVAS